MLRVVQISHPRHGRRIAVVSEPHLRLLPFESTIYELALSAIAAKQPLRAALEAADRGEFLVYDEIYHGRSEWQLLAPIDHPEPSRCFVTGTGLTHKASAENRQSMHVDDRKGRTALAAAPPLTDSMKMFQIGLEGGRPAA